jgi:Ca2+-binding EF-hand superfamily protein
MGQVSVSVGYLTRHTAVAAELKGLLLGLSISTDDSSALQRELDYWMHEFDADRSGQISYREFRMQLARSASVPSATTSVHLCCNVTR